MQIKLSGPFGSHLSLGPRGTSAVATYSYITAIYNGWRNNERKLDINEKYNHRPRLQVAILLRTIIRSRRRPWILMNYWILMNDRARPIFRLPFPLMTSSYMKHNSQRGLRCISFDVFIDRSNWFYNTRASYLLTQQNQAIMLQARFQTDFRPSGIRMRAGDRWDWQFVYLILWRLSVSPEKWTVQERT